MEENITETKEHNIKLYNSPLFKKGAIIFCLIVILVLAAIFRFTGIDWDSGHHLHPDERFLTMVQNALSCPESFSEYMDESISPLNPRNQGYGFFVYGSLPMTIVKAVGLSLNQTGYDHIHLVGRHLNGILDLLTVLFIFLITRTLYKDNRIALLAGFFYSTAVFAIQQSHFFTVDTFACFFTTVTIYWLARVQTEGKYWNFLLTGIFFGMALASKLSIYTLVVVIIGVSIYRILTGSEKKLSFRIWKNLVMLFLAGFATLLPLW